MNVVNANNILLGRGELFFDRYNASGIKTGERFLGNCESFALSIEDETRDKYSSAEPTAPLIKSVVVRRTPTLTIVLNEFDEDNLSLAFMGDKADFLQTAGTVTDEAIPTTSIKKGYWFQLGPLALPARNIAAAPVIRSAAGGGGTLYVINTDYIVDLVRARIFVVAGGAIPNAGPLFVTYTRVVYVAGNLPTAQAGISSFIEGFLRFIGRPATGPIWEVEVWRASMSPDGEVAFIGDDYASYTMKGKVLADTVLHPLEPYFRAYKLS